VHLSLVLHKNIVAFVTNVLLTRWLLTFQAKLCIQQLPVFGTLVAYINRSSACKMMRQQQQQRQQASYQLMPNINMDSTANPKNTNSN
jgi:hypothetical protein